MNPNKTYHRYLSFVIAAIMLWNVAGWLGFGILMHHAHTHGEKDHCEIMLCNCEVEDGDKICTCHHNGINGNESQKEGNHHQEGCHYTASHSNNSSSTPSLVVITKHTALFDTEDHLIIKLEDSLPRISNKPPTLSGVGFELLRPPRI